MKTGLGDSYDNVQFIPKKMRAYCDICKPASTVGVAGGFLIASVLYFYLQNNPSGVLDNFRDIIYACATVAFAHGASQALNMAEDAEMDRETPHKQNRPIPAGVISEDEARTVAWILAGAAILRGYLVSVEFGMMILFLLGFGVFYNLDPIRAKERIISIPWQAASRGFFLMPAVWAAHGDMLSTTPWVFGAILFLYVMAYQNSADIADRHVDEKHGISTFVVMFGVRKTGYIAAACTVIMAGLIVISTRLRLIPQSFFYTLLILPFCCVMLYYMIFRSDEIEENSGNSPAWLLYYAGMMLFVSIPLGAEIL